MVNAKCKKCNKEVLASLFVLDPVYQMMVCPACVRERKSAEAKAESESKPEHIEVHIPRPPGWDAEDEYLEKATRIKERDIVRCERVDDQTVKYKCPKCHYTFSYNAVTQRPRVCPYCSGDIKKIQVVVY
ncbi:MAG: hypothetical protein U9R08_06495 [Nanoarchaeota archaeon]|nr:hypothetical protein [Nanoarchaeota archaeon]